MEKIFITGLPRTGTTSVCAAFLELGFKTAHTAYTRETFSQAQVIADTPIFNDYETLSELYPNSRFVYLDRAMSSWVPSIRRLLTRMLPRLETQQGGFNDTLKRCYFDTFEHLSADNLECDQYLIESYHKHRADCLSFLERSQQTYLILDVAQPDSLQTLTDFLDIHTDLASTMPNLNQGGKVTAWKQIDHPLKVESTRNGKADRDSLLYSTAYTNFT
ncbi:sulfotransferase family protein [Pseudoalteromonas rubra]|uniref:Sulfotransferase family protein n=1 Tax=Pseudoalteromonas rubra TaxID=43658 RepID=A0A5S3WS06_9GAMM|nr:sulfotransferase [Pseudoalteromonas rubra]TMP30178.1 sulfotransferase family protein [Pseudoalteromonas rubra]TMP31954.1 sulfotransferase family protein [Pseudoalteromonas rubra]